MGRVAKKLFSPLCHITVDASNTGPELALAGGGSTNIFEAGRAESVIMR